MATIFRPRGRVIAVGMVVAAAAIGLCSSLEDQAKSARTLQVSELKAKVDAVVHPMVSSGERVGILVGVMLPERTEFFGYGETFKGSNAEPDGKTLFQIGSITKTFTTLLLADMVERNIAELEDPVDDLLPGSVRVLSSSMGRKVTLLDLATHTSGLPAMPTNFKPKDELNPYADYSAEMLYEFLSGHTLTRNPGLLYEYSNLGMALLGHALSLRAGATFESLVLDRICSALGMTDTRITLSADDQHRLAQGYWGEWDSDASPPGYRHEAVPHWEFDVFAPAGGLYSNGWDMAAYLRANMGMLETNLSSAIKITHSTSREIPSQDIRILLGWHAMDHDGARVIMHHGATYGFNSNALFIKEEGVGVVLLSNTYVPESGTLDDAGLEILQILRESVCISNYGRLSSDHATLQAEFDALNSGYLSLNSSYSILRGEFDELRSSCNELNSSHEGLMQDQQATNRRLSKLRSAMYLFAGTTIALLLVAGCAAIRAARRSETTDPGFPSQMARDSTE